MPYFYSYGQPGGDQPRSVMCPQCVLQHIEHEPEKLEAHYAVNRMVMCASCGILIGPSNDKEMVEYE